MVQIAYRTLHCGWTLEQATEEIASTFGLKEVAHGPDYRQMTAFYNERVLPSPAEARLNRPDADSLNARARISFATGDNRSPSSPRIRKVPRHGTQVPLRSPSYWACLPRRFNAMGAGRFAAFARFTPSVAQRGRGQTQFRRAMPRTR